MLLKVRPRYLALLPFQLDGMGMVYVAPMVSFDHIRPLTIKHTNSPMQ